MGSHHDSDGICLQLVWSHGCSRQFLPSRFDTLTDIDSGSSESLKLAFSRALITTCPAGTVGQSSASVLQFSSVPLQFLALSVVSWQLQLRRWLVSVVAPVGLGSSFWKVS